jgi:uncharacterized protein
MQQSKAHSIPYLHLASGDVLAIQVYRFGQTDPEFRSAPKVYIQSNLHGAEIVGNAVTVALMEWLATLESHQLKGEIWLVPSCNPSATNQRAHYFSTGRFNPYDGKDWNRIFWEYKAEPQEMMNFAKSQLELSSSTVQSNFSHLIQSQFEKLAEKLRSSSGAPVSEHYRFHLQSLCLDADYLIDIHSTSNQGLDYLYYFSGREQSAACFGLDWGILLDQYDGDAFDEAFMKPWLALEDCFQTLGRSLQFDKEAWTLELGCGMQIKPESVQKGVAGIQNYLVQKRVVHGVLLQPLTLQPPYLSSTGQIKKYYASFGGAVFPAVRLGDVVEEGQVLYQLLCFNKQAQPPVRLEVVAEQNGVVYDLATNQSVNQGEYVLATF